MVWLKYKNVCYVFLRYRRELELINVTFCFRTGHKKQSPTWKSCPCFTSLTSFLQRLLQTDPDVLSKTNVMRAKIIKSLTMQFSCKVIVGMSFLGYNQNYQTLTKLKYSCFKPYWEGLGTSRVFFTLTKNAVHLHCVNWSLKVAAVAVCTEHMISYTVALSYGIFIINYFRVFFYFILSVVWLRLWAKVFELFWMAYWRWCQRACREGPDWWR